MACSTSAFLAALLPGLVDGQLLTPVVGVFLAVQVGVLVGRPLSAARPDVTAPAPYPS